MVLRIFLFMCGFGLMVTGFNTIILYINLFSFGYNFKEYLSYIIKYQNFIIFYLGLYWLIFLF